MSEPGLFDVGVTRDLIFRQSLSKPSQKCARSKDVRRSLGWRETDKQKSVPKFHSDHMLKLYSELDQLAEELPWKEGPKKLQTEWMKGVLLQTEILELYNSYGPGLWDIPTHQRDPEINPDSPLFFGAKDMVTDLHMDVPEHAQLLVPCIPPAYMAR